ncbi:MAG TPA: hypothetical protein VJ691_02675 [Vicinamibacterales bacterium]|nr:hypothetical protein [Vicinamibacterales bacterium]
MLWGGLLIVIAASSPAFAQDDVIAMASSTAEAWLGPRKVSESVDRTTSPLWQGRRAMIVESNVAERVIRSWWPEHIADDQGRAIIDGFSRYMQALVIEQVFDRRYLRQAHRVESMPYLGGHVIWSVPPLRLSRHSAVRGDRYAAVFASLERWIGVPTLQVAMFEVAQLPAAKLTGTEIIKTISDAAGQDLSWAFAAAQSDVNYFVTQLVSSPASECESPCFDSMVTVSRAGEGAFRAIDVELMFADGGHSSVVWDGRDGSRIFRFRGPAPATAAYLDPRRQVTLDSNLLDNAIVAPAPTNVPVRKWVARWMVWLQHTMLTYGFLA